MKKLTALLALSLLCLGGACSKKDKDADKKDTAGKTAEPAKADPKPAAAFTGDLTIDRVMASKGTVKPFDDWATGLAKLEATMGKATSIHGDDYRWAAVADGTCAYTTVEKMKTESGPQVGAVSHPKTVDKETGPEGSWHHCTDAAGVVMEEPEDPNAPDLPAAGDAVTPSTLLAGVKGKKAKWVGQSVTLKGFYVSTSTTTANEEQTITLSIAETKGEIKGSIGCTLKKGSEAPELTQWDELTVTGKVHDTFGGGMDECELSK